MPDLLKVPSCRDSRGIFPAGSKLLQYGSDETVTLVVELIRNVRIFS